MGFNGFILITMKIIFSHPIGIIAKEFHSIAYSANDIYVWGLNGGQFGLKSEIPFVYTPQKV